jgi:hypothetical protein
MKNTNKKMIYIIDIQSIERFFQRIFERYFERILLD